MAASPSGQATALGIFAKEEGGSVTLWYRDGTQVPPGLIGSNRGKLEWAAGYPDTTDPNKTAVNFVELGKISNDLAGNYSDGTRPFLSYICEAKPFTTIGGDDPFKPCHFPFKTAANSSWSHSCLYDKDVLGRDLVWCATEVDQDGVVVPGKKGVCDDERNTAYAGPGLNLNSQYLFVNSMYLLYFVCCVWPEVWSPSLITYDISQFGPQK
jgi:hypothetical protein